ncbi:MAG: hypothetical protein ABSG16_24900 [Candidatus Acidiferrum sp.]
MLEQRQFAIYGGASGGVISAKYRSAPKNAVNGFSSCSSLNQERLLVFAYSM